MSKAVSVHSERSDRLKSLLKFGRANCRSDRYNPPVATSVDVFHQALGLSAEQRANLAVELLDSLSKHGFEDPAVASAWQEELSTRHAEYRAGQAETCSWDDVNALLLNTESQHDD